MTTPVGHAKPLFELKGPLSKIDLSAWLAGLSYCLSINIIGIGQFVNALRNPATLATVIVALIFFFIATIALQRFIGISLKATEYGKPARLVMGGPFAYSRNPIYVTFFVPLISLAIISPIACTIAFAFYITSMNLTVLRIEERDLLNKFGNDFTSYASKTRRWL
jgi:protein-S-isoprenylcysteine O-methyltransferase Ste14